MVNGNGGHIEVKAALGSRRLHSPERSEEFSQQVTVRQEGEQGVKRGSLWRNSGKNGGRRARAGNRGPYRGRNCWPNCGCNDRRMIGNNVRRTFPHAKCNRIKGPRRRQPARQQLRKTLPILQSECRGCASSNSEARSRLPRWRRRSSWLFREQQFTALESAIPRSKWEQNGRGLWKSGRMEGER